MISTMYKDYECITEKQQNSNPYPVIFKISFEKYGKIFESNLEFIKKYPRI